MKLQLSYPTKKVYINQGFGKNNLTVYKDQGMNGHNGIDFMAPHGTPIYASHDGYASYQVDGAGGHGVVLITDKEYEYGDGQCYFKTIYWHMVDFLREPQYKSPIADKTGFTFIKRGEVIGYANNTGQSTGSHLHFGLKPVVRGEHWGTWYNLESQNGFYGSIDPKPYLPQETIIEFTKWMKRGDENEEVQKLQAFFLRTGRMKPILKGFGYYGPATQMAVKQFQIDNGIVHNNGYQAGPKTLLALNLKYEI